MRSPRDCVRIVPGYLVKLDLPMPEIEIVVFILQGKVFIFGFTAANPLLVRAIFSIAMSGECA